MTSALIKPILTEKALSLSETSNQYTFEIHSKAEAGDVKKEVEKRFNVKVTSVRTLIAKGKAKVQFTRKGVRYGKLSDVKKAIVTLAKDNKIDYYGGSSSQSTETK